MPQTFTQQNQPDGVPPLALTGERTLPDIPQENYWFQRHLVVYEWIAQACERQRVVDLACGEGYGTDVLARCAGEAVGVDANPDAHEHARRRYRRDNLRFERDLIETFDTGSPYDCVVFLQTIEHLEDPGGSLEHMCGLLEPGGTAFISTPNRLTLASPGADKSDNPWHVREYTAAEFAELLAPHFARVDLVGVFHARKLLVHEYALKLGWDQVHRTLRLSDLFYSWFTPAIGSRDFRIGQGDLNRSLDLVAICRR